MAETISDYLIPRRENPERENKMLIGLSTTVLWDYERLDLPNAIFHSVEGLGFETVEIPCEDPLFKGWGTEEVDVARKEVKETLSTLDIESSLHAPFHDLNMGTLNRRIGKEVIHQHEECIETARYFDSSVVVVHPGFVSSRKYQKEDAFQQMVRNLKEITDVAADAGVTVCLENLAFKKKAMGVEIPDLERILKEVNRENLKLALDVAHANTTKEGPLEYAKRLKENIAHIHISDNAGDDDHLAIGQGNIDFESVLEELQPYDGNLIVEGWIPKDEDPFLEMDLRELKRIREELSL